MMITCTKCGWVHMGVTRAYAETQVREFAVWWAQQPPEVREMYGTPSVSVAEYESCWCGASYKTTRPTKEGDCPDGVTIGPLLAPGE